MFRGVTSLVCLEGERSKVNELSVSIDNLWKETKKTLNASELRDGN